MPPEHLFVLALVESGVCDPVRGLADLSDELLGGEPVPAPITCNLSRTGADLSREFCRGTLCLFMCFRFGGLVGSDLHFVLEVGLHLNKSLRSPLIFRALPFPI